MIRTSHFLLNGANPDILCSLKYVLCSLLAIRVAINQPYIVRDVWLVPLDNQFHIREKYLLIYSHLGFAKKEVPLDRLC